MKQKSFDNQGENEGEFFRSIMLYKLYAKFQLAHPEMSDPESFVAFFASINNYEELEQLIDQEKKEVGKAQFDIIMLIIEANEILDGTRK